MNAIGWILIILLFLVIGLGVFLLIWYFVDRSKKTTPGPIGPSPPPPVTGNLSILTTSGKPEYAITNDTSGNVILRDPAGPTGATGANLNVCSRYSWSYNGGTGTIGPLGGTGMTGPAGMTGTVSGGTGGVLGANWETNSASKYLKVNTTTIPVAGNTVITGPTGDNSSVWIFVPNSTDQSKGKWCLRNVTDRLLCLYSGVTGATGGAGGAGQQLTVQEFRIGNTINEANPSFVFSNHVPLTTETTPTCNVG